MPVADPSRGGASPLGEPRRRLQARSRPPDSRARPRSGSSDLGRTVASRPRGRRAGVHRPRRRSHPRRLRSRRAQELPQPRRQCAPRRHAGVDGSPPPDLRGGRRLRPRHARGSRAEPARARLVSIGVHRCGRSPRRSRGRRGQRPGRLDRSDRPFRRQRRGSRGRRHCPGREEHAGIGGSGRCRLRQGSGPDVPLRRSPRSQLLSPVCDGPRALLLELGRIRENPRGSTSVLLDGVSVVGRDCRRRHPTRRVHLRGRRRGSGHLRRRSLPSSRGVRDRPSGTGGLRFAPQHWYRLPRRSIPTGFDRRDRISACRSTISLRVPAVRGAPRQFPEVELRQPGRSVRGHPRWPPGLAPARDLPRGVRCGRDDGNRGFGTGRRAAGRRVGLRPGAHGLEQQDRTAARELTGVGERALRTEIRDGPPADLRRAALRVARVEPRRRRPNLRRCPLRPARLPSSRLRRRHPHHSQPRASDLQPHAMVRSDLAGPRGVFRCGARRITDPESEPSGDQDGRRPRPPLRRGMGTRHERLSRRCGLRVSARPRRAQGLADLVLGGAGVLGAQSSVRAPAVDSWKRERAEW